MRRPAATCPRPSDRMQTHPIPPDNPAADHAASQAANNTNAQPTEKTLNSIHSSRKPRVLDAHSRVFESTSRVSKSTSRVSESTSRVLGPYSRVLHSYARVLRPYSRVLYPYSRLLSRRPHPTQRRSTTSRPRPRHRCAARTKHLWLRRRILLPSAPLRDSVHARIQGGFAGRGLLGLFTIPDQI
jgi:hypothetical protein